MSDYNTYRRWGAIFFALFLLFFLGACGNKKRVAPPVIVPVDDVTESAIDLLWRGLYNDADREFDWALKQNSKNTRANTGRALVQGYLGNFDEAFRLLKNGCKYAKENDDRLFCYEVTIRLHTLDKRDKLWFQKAREAFIAGNKVDPRASRPYFYMALACKENLYFDEAENLFQEVISKNSGYVKESQRQLRQLEDIFGAMPVTKTGQNIVLKRRISRADCAALIIEEMKFGHMIWGEAALQKENKDFKNLKRPEKIKTFSAKDIKDHPFAIYIENVLSLNLAGLQTYSDGMFRPDEYLDRGGFAVVIAAMMKKISPEKMGLSTPISSPFADVQETSPFYEAVMIVASQEIMEAIDKTREEFAPLGPLSGAEALLALKKLKKIFHSDEREEQE